MTIRPIHTENDHKRALQRIEKIFDARRGSPEGDELEILGILVEEYESRHFPIESPDPVEAIKFRLEQLGLTQSDLARILGSRSRTSEILAGKRKLSISMIRTLHESLNIPAEILIKDSAI